MDRNQEVLGWHYQKDKQLALVYIYKGTCIITGGNQNWYIYFGKQYEGFLKTVKLEQPFFMLLMNI